MGGLGRYTSKFGVGMASLSAATLLLVAACGSSSSSPSSGGSGGGGLGGAASASATVDTHRGPLGKYLTNAKGLALYMFASDTAHASTCSGSCVTYWPPVTVKASASAGSGASSGMLGTIRRSDGSQQVTYDGHPLYTFSEDTSPGDTKGQGSTAFGAKWWLVAPSGKPITKTSGSATKSSGGYGGY